MTGRQAHSKLTQNLGSGPIALDQKWKKKEKGQKTGGKGRGREMALDWQNLARHDNTVPGQRFIVPCQYDQVILSGVLDSMIPSSGRINSLII